MTPAALLPRLLLAVVAHDAHWIRAGRDGASSSPSAAPPPSVLPDRDAEAPGHLRREAAPVLSAAALGRAGDDDLGLVLVYPLFMAEGSSCG